MLKAIIVTCFYILMLGYVSMELDWRDGKGRGRHLYLKGWQESDLQELIWVAIFSIVMIGGISWFFR